MFRLFNSDKHGGGEPRVKVHSDPDKSRISADKYTTTDADKGHHSHDSFSLNTQTGEYREYSGGDKSSDRSYNGKDGK
ncbi:MAG: hypothetical protein P4M09_01545 [Devosia sp.]|nr:hypothetical protein [Devosia sp.]